VLKNLTISADPVVIAKARAKAAAEHTTLNDVVRRFLADFAHVGRAADYDSVMASMGACRSGGHFSRDDANAR
jgi:hypothetical protein